MRRRMVCVSVYCVYVRIMRTLPAYVCVRVCMYVYAGGDAYVRAEKTKLSAIFTLCRDYR